MNHNNVPPKHQLLTVQSTCNGDTDDKVQRQNTILRPDEEIIALDDLEPLPNVAYGFMVILLVITFLLLLGGTVNSVHDPQEFVLHVVVLNTLVLYTIQYFAGILNVFYGLKTAYSRKIVHITLFTMPFIVDALVGQLNEDDSGIAVGWNLWGTQCWFMWMTIPVRNACNKVLGKVTDEDNPKWRRYLNFPSLIHACFDRSEDRPNTLKWLQTQIVLMYLFIIILFIANSAETVISMEALLLIPTIIGGFGDGLAEPVGRKWGANYQYKTHGCCTEYDYTRSYPGSFMVWLSGLVAVGFNFDEFTINQFIIGIIVIPIVGTVTEAKAPHTMDNPFIVLLVGFTVMGIAALPF